MMLNYTNMDLNVNVNPPHAMTKLESKTNLVLYQEKHHRKRMSPKKQHDSFSSYSGFEGHHELPL